MKKLLFISAHAPSLKANYAGHKSAYNILKILSSKYSVDIALICSKSEYIEDFQNSDLNVNLIHLEKLSIFSKIKNYILCKFTLPKKVGTRYSVSLGKFIKNNGKKYHRIHFEFTHAAATINFAANHSLKNCLLSVSCHDILIQAELRKKNIFPWINDIKSTFLFEQKVYNLVDFIYAHNQKDKNLLSSLFGIKEEKIEVVHPPLCDFVNIANEINRKKTKKLNRKIIFWGAMNRKENEEAVISFWKINKDFFKKTNLKLLIVGANPSKSIKALNGENVVVTGFVDDPTPYFIDADIGIAPVLTGAGIKVKTLEMLASGLPVIATPVGAEGISDKNLTICNITEFQNKLKEFYKFDC